MNTYAIALFMHIVGALGLFAALGLEWTGLQQIRNAVTADQVRVWMQVLNSMRRLGPVSMLTTVVFGVYMTVAAWGAVGWIVVALAAIVLTMALGMALTGPRMAATGRALANEKGALSEAFRALATDQLLWISMQTRVAVALGIVFLMTVKPGLGGSLLTIGVAVVLGLAWSLPGLTRQRVQEKPAG